MSAEPQEEKETKVIKAAKAIEVLGDILGKMASRELVQNRFTDVTASLGVLESQAEMDVKVPPGVLESQENRVKMGAEVLREKQFAAQRETAENVEKKVHVVLAEKWGLLVALEKMDIQVLQDAEESADLRELLGAPASVETKEIAGKKENEAPLVDPGAKALKDLEVKPELQDVKASEDLRVLLGVPVPREIAEDAETKVLEDLQVSLGAKALKDLEVKLALQDVKVSADLRVLLAVPARVVTKVREVKLELLVVPELEVLWVLLVAREKREKKERLVRLAAKEIREIAVKMEKMAAASSNTWCEKQTFRRIRMTSRLSLFAMSKAHLELLCMCT